MLNPQLIFMVIDLLDFAFGYIMHMSHSQVDDIIFPNLKSKLISFVSLNFSVMS